jgi:hypothetical protein
VTKEACVRLPLTWGRLVAGLGVLRLGFGVGMLARPGLLTSPLAADATPARAGAWLAEMVGGREVALGGGLVLARQSPRLWLLAAALSDGADALVLLRAAHRRDCRPLPARLVALFAVAGATAEIAAAAAESAPGRAQ